MPKSEKIRSRAPKLTIFLILFCFLYFTFSWPNYWNTNEYSRIFLTRALIDYNTFSIDKIIATHNTQDKSFYKGHYYSNKAPGSSFIATPVYLTIRLLGIYTRIVLSEEIVLYIIKAVCLSLPSALFLFLLFKFWAYITLLYPVRRALLIAYALGTLVWPYSSLFYGHQLAGMSLFLAFLILFNSRELSTGNKVMFQAGFFCGLAFSLEYPSLLISFLIFIYATAVFKNTKAVVYLTLGTGLTWLLQGQFDFLVSAFGPQWALVLIIFVAVIFLLVTLWQAPVLFFYLMGILIPVGATLYYHWQCFGGPLQFPYYFETYPPFAIAHSRGIAGVTIPQNLSELRSQLSALLQLFISPYRGLIFYSPFLIFGLSGIFKMMRSSEWRKEGGLFFAIVVVYFIFLSAFSDWEGGWSMGPRHLTPLMPFLVTAIVFQVGKGSKKSQAGMAWLLTPLVLIALVLTFIGTAVFPYFPKEFKNPLYDLSWQFLIRGEFAPTLGEWWGLPGAMRLVPLIIMLGILIVTLLRDLSWLFSRKPVNRLGFSIVCMLITGGLLLLGERGSRWRSDRLSPKDISLQEFQKERVASFMREEKKYGNL